MHKDVPFAWENKHEAAFNALQDLVTSKPVLRQPQLDKPFEVKVDASSFALGGVLLQRQEDGKKHPIGYYSATLNEAQRNYNIYELELLAITECLKHWRPYLASSPHEIIVHTDHVLHHGRDIHPTWVKSLYRDTGFEGSGFKY